MDIYDLEAAFGAADVTTPAMRQAVSDWFAAYYEQSETAGSDPCQRVAYTVVNKLIKTIFAEYTASCDRPLGQQLLAALEPVKEEAVQLALVGGECYLRPVLQPDGLRFLVVPRDRILIFQRDLSGAPTDVGCAARSFREGLYYTLLERRTVDSRGYLTVKNQLFASRRADALGNPVSLHSLKEYEQLSAAYTYRQPVHSIGLVRLKTPMLNCVDGSNDGVSVYGAALGLIAAINENEAQLRGEFQRGQSRILVSRDLLDRDKRLTDNLFVGLDEDPDRVGITIFAPQLREKSFLDRKQEYLRNIESVIGLKRGMLSYVNESQRTATEIAASAAEFNLTVMGFQRMWVKAMEEALALSAVLAELYSLPAGEPGRLSVDWGNGVLYDEDAQWEAYRVMVADGILKPEIALGWRFNMPIATAEDLKAIRTKYMPEVVSG